MRELTAYVAGADRPVYVVETAEDAEEAMNQILAQAKHGPVALDTETTGLEIYQDGFRVRVVQFGFKHEAWVFPVEADPALRWAVVVLLQEVPSFVAQNKSFDIRCLQVDGLSGGGLWEKTTDTYLMAHILDPREKVDGGTGHGLEELSAAYFDPDAMDFKDALVARFKELGFQKSKEDGWGPAYSEISIDDEVFLRYAGVDVILASWLYEALRPLIVAGGFEMLLEFEERLAKICGDMMDRGILVDAEYMERLGPELTAEADRAERVAKAYGVENVNSTAQVAEALLSLGAPLETKTKKTGKWKVDKEVLEGLVDAGGRWDDLASAVMTAKNSKGFRVKYVDKVLENLDSAGRIHADIRSLKARTARMAVANPPLQQLPSGDWKIRRGFIPAPGHVMVACDLNQVELVVLAVLAQERRMMRAIREGDDLHQITADSADVPRRVGKMANFLMVYGGGAGKLARSAGIPLSEAKKVVSSYHRTFPGVKRHSRRIMDRAEMGRRDVRTPTGRILPMDRDRVYAGLNYLVQSTARDVMGQAMIRMEDAGVAEYLVMVVHDEALAEVPVDLVDEVSAKIQEAMTFENFLGSGVDITAEAEVYGASWGHGYGAAE